MNNTYNNAISGILVVVGGNTAASFANAINTANIYGVTANVVSGNININYSVPGPIFISEIDTVNTPLANAGITSGKYGAGVSSFTITGTKTNPTFNATSKFGLGINWNAILNAVPKAQRRNLKEIWIAQQERKKVGTPSYRVLHNFIDTKSPVVGHPWGP